MIENNLDEAAELLTADDLLMLAPVMIVAPHQDDESLGCGGTIALLRQLKVAVHVVFVSDGSMSHPNSKKYPSTKLVSLREKEAITALSILGVAEENISFLRLKDGMLPTYDSPLFTEVVELLKAVIARSNPKTVFVPWQRDPHPDHRACWQILVEAIEQLGVPVRRLEYLIWLWERAKNEDLPTPGEVKIWQVDITKTLASKRDAILAHISQTSLLIDDDPNGFTLSEQVLSHFNKPVELFIEQ